MEWFEIALVDYKTTEFNDIVRDYNLEVLKENIIVQSIHVAARKLDLKRKRERQIKRKKQNKQSTTARTEATPATETAQNFFKMVLILIPYCNGTLYKCYLMINQIW